ncbi:septal ring lytic transglycosylase RlpA family protein [Caviibacterium pharyngocola]|uniref:Endolytic peptidoglycan transglycosylase RlpA n=1 Tax=Caviibacterium pharyngocola TaxID=28159 RepID=A0A2M8RVB7_9PAST|nr:septal ring lytic transglycosylase RlpA family protein [Caviibacterium pharyngocola]PJG82813.1 septal ring lytic transglycosylase RlpA family lipoprotein [Caviibacterium pharyngocola]
MKLTKTLKCILALSIAAVTLSTQAETKKLYGVQGPKLTYKQPTTKSHSYQVKGVTYTTKTHHNAKNYSKEGVASYYHAKFSGRRTSNGELYSPALYTAAHKTLPLNSYALVTNLHNNRKVIVRINDRGPFTRGRIIDLSSAAAKEIGLLARGTGNVRVEALHVSSEGKISGPAAAALAKTTTHPEGLSRLDTSAVENSAKNKKPSENMDGYKIRMLNVNSKQQAEQVIAELALENVKAEISQNGKKYDIHFGPVTSKNEVNRLKAQLQKLNRSKQLIVYGYN